MDYQDTNLIYPLSVIVHTPSQCMIQDTGLGIDAEIMSRLFSKFATKSDTGGTGLGLFISKSIIEAHGSTISAGNNEDGKRGATFTFTLPLSK
jgi:signal transduction histidine kinase